MLRPSGLLIELGLDDEGDEDDMVVKLQMAQSLPTLLLTTIYPAQCSVPKLTTVK